MNPTNNNDDLVFGYCQQGKELSFGLLDKEARELGITVSVNCSLLRSVAQKLIDRANERRDTPFGHKNYRTLPLPLGGIQTTSTSTKGNKSMKLNISRAALIAGLTSYVKTKTEENKAALAAYNKSRSTIEEFVNGNKELVANINSVPVAEVTPKMVKAKVDAICTSFGIPTAFSVTTLDTVQSMIAKLSLATDESIELLDTDPILAHFNVVS